MDRRTFGLGRYRVDTAEPNPARRYNYWLGGKDNFAVDRASGDAIEQMFPHVRAGVHENRRFMQRTVGWLARCGIRQFLDIGTGIPMPSGNVHDIAQRIAPESRIVCVDHDQLVMAHDRALLMSSPEGRVAYIEADLRDPEGILRNPDLAETLDLNEPVAVLIIAVMHFFADDDDPYGCVSRMMRDLPSGSHLVLSHADQTNVSPNIGDTHGSFQPRDRRQVADFFAGLELISPGLVSVVDWRPKEPPEPRFDSSRAAMYGAVAVKL